MKATEAQLDRIREAVAPLDTAEHREAYASGNYPNADRTKDVDKRYRWDLLNAGGGWELTCALYDEGLTDEHIDTALRSIVAPLAEAREVCGLCGTRYAAKGLTACATCA